MSDLHQRDIENEILDILEEKGPLTTRQIVEQLNIAQSTCEMRLRKFVEEGKLLRISAKNSGKIYFALSKGGFTAEEYDNLRDVIVKDTVDTKDAYEVLSEKIARIDDNVNGLFANMISIISILVAIFALITVNANIAFELTQENLQGVFVGIIAINVFVVICIVVLLICVKLIIINPMLGKKRKKKSKRG
ncbi:MAG TPA: winged helix-turn-helix domain-containing protein [Candidatus Acetatifactor stercoripullorum]|uniref:Winged helix-turn-helix domain-containing protein n=1 Tax=Candidatus Acetatifactor stercoripullorum TaxID=2838414 RepID=A0A9D1R7E4_9FIRM|nr:winged helix-turn-helix domain-containing protein [Candidatus Acetatifactor stercoripullorum]